MLLIHIMGICCGPFEFFCLGGQYYGSGHPNIQGLQNFGCTENRIEIEVKCGSQF